MAEATATTPGVPKWPGENRAACAFTFDMDAETLWMARGVHEPVTLSQGRFGPIEALPRILALLEKADARASFFIPAWVASHYADAVLHRPGPHKRTVIPPALIVTVKPFGSPPSPTVKRLNHRIAERVQTSLRMPRASATDYAEACISVWVAHSLSSGLVLPLAPGVSPP